MKTSYYDLRQGYAIEVRRESGFLSIEVAAIKSYRGRRSVDLSITGDSELKIPTLRCPTRKIDIGDIAVRAKERPRRKGHGGREIRLYCKTPNNYQSRKIRLK